jgi:hypothetical protein
MNNKFFTQDWFSQNIERFQRHLNKFIDKPNLNFLEIGSFEGRSTCWILENILTGDDCKIFCIDSFEGGYDHDKIKINFKNVLGAFKNNTLEYKDKIFVYEQNSFKALLSSEINCRKYDFIYIDGSHIAKEVMEDIVLSFNLLKKDGIMIFDDYGWQDSNSKNWHLGKPSDAIDFFLKFYLPFIEVLEVNYQVVIKKTGE